MPECLYRRSYTHHDLGTRTPNPKMREGRPSTHLLCRGGGGGGDARVDGQWRCFYQCLRLRCCKWGWVGGSSRENFSRERLAVKFSIARYETFSSVRTRFFPPCFWGLSSIFLGLHTLAAGYGSNSCPERSKFLKTGQNAYPEKSFFFLLQTFFLSTHVSNPPSTGHGILTFVTRTGGEYRGTGNEALRPQDGLIAAVTHTWMMCHGIELVFEVTFGHLPLPSTPP